MNICVHSNYVQWVNIGTAEILWKPQKAYDEDHQDT